MLLAEKKPDASTTGESSSPLSALFRAASPGPRPAAAHPGSAPAPASDAGHSRMLIVGPGISLSGEITACDRLVVEGTVKVVLNKTRAIEIAESGIFTEGKADVEEAVVSGVYEGELTVRGRLLIRATGRVTGSVRYGELEVEQGGRLTGSLAVLDG